MNSQSLKGLFLLALVVGMSPSKAKAEADDRLQIWKYESRVRVEAALQSAQAEIVQAQQTTPENVFDFSDSGFQIVVVNSDR